MARIRTELKVEPAPKKWLTTQELCSYLGCSSDFVQTLRDNAEVSFSKYGKMIWYDIASVERFIKRYKVI